MIGPALGGIFGRRDSLWVVKAILDFDLLLGQDDLIATQLHEEYSWIRHLLYPFSDEDMRLLIEFIKEEEKKDLPTLTYEIIACP